MKLPDKKYLGAFFAGVLWGAVIVFIAGVILLRMTLIREYKCSMDFDQTVNKVTANASRISGWIVKSSSCSLPKPTDGAKMWTVTLCNGKYASAMLNDEDSRKIASVIPCQFSIYQKKDGSVYLSRLNVKLFGMLIGGMPGKVFRAKVAPEQELMLEGVIEK